MTINVGDKVKVIEDVWDDHRDSSWLGWEGVVVEIWTPAVQGYAMYYPEDKESFFVHFPKARGRCRNFDFHEEELEIIERRQSD